jgi:uncharacterized protein YcbX
MNLENSMKVTRISIYPVKATREIPLTTVEVRRRGLAGDRRWMVVDKAGDFLQQRVVPKLALVATLLQSDGSLILDAPAMSRLHVSVPNGSARIPVTVWGDKVVAADVGPQAAEWLSKYLERECRLVYMDRDAERPVAEAYGQAGDVVSFADAVPLLLATEVSLADLNQRIGRSLPMSRFRPNVTIDGVEAWEEDDWKQLRIGDVEFEVTHRCARCVVTAIDQESGVKDESGEPLKTLATFRRDSDGIYFGQNMVPRSLGTIRVGDSVTVVR